MGVIDRVRRTRTRTRSRPHTRTPSPSPTPKQAQLTLAPSRAQGQFCSVIGLLFAGAQKQRVIDGLVKVYGTGDPVPSGGLSHVRSMTSPRTLSRALALALALSRGAEP